MARGAGGIKSRVLMSRVDRTLKMHKDQPKAKTNLEKTAIERQIQATDNEIDTLV
jgi:hypothetical protein